MNELTEMLHAMMPLCKTLGIRALVMEPAEVRAELEHRADLCTSNGILHGGAIMTLADSAAAACAFSNLPDGAKATSTIEGKTNFMGAVTEGSVEAVARPIHAGSMTIVVETEVRQGDRLIAKTLQTQAVLR